MKSVAVEARGLQLKRRSFGPMDLVFRAGEMVVLCGASGSGKSTLCELLAETQEPSEGSLQRGETRIGYVAHAFENQLVGSTVEEELLIGVRGSDSLPDEALRVTLQLLEEPLLPYLTADPHEISSALQQHLLVASLVRGGARFLILDESLAYLDSHAQERFSRALISLVECGCTVLLVTHQAELLEMANRVVFLERGVVAFEGGSDEFRTSHFERAGFRVEEVGQFLVSRLPCFPEGEGGVEVRPGDDRLLQLPRRTSLVLGGPSGSGTSRALNSLMGLESWPGWTCSGDRQKSCLLRQNVAPSFWRSRCAEEIKASRSAHTEVSRALEEAVLNSIPASWLEKAPWQLSHGQLRFFGACCLLLQNPVVLYLDHPFQGLDGVLREKLRYCLLEYLKADGRVVLTTHFRELVSGLGHQVIWLESGRTVWVGPVSDWL
ncbi:MAG: ATP-binding cassette domain-containing protein [Vulcanimicrobiota bacterium]